MKKISDTLCELIIAEPFLEKGVREGLFNGAALARFLQPVLQARLKKEITLASIQMALSRAKIDFEHKHTLREERFVVTDLGVRGNLEVVSYKQSLDVRKALEKLYRRLQSKDVFVTLTEGRREVTLIFDRTGTAIDFELLGSPLVHHQNVGCVSIYFPKQEFDTPGFLHAVFEQLYFQGINIIEITSTSWELLIYVEQEDLQLSFDTIFQRFASSSS